MEEDRSTVFDNINEVDLKKTMEEYYIDYSMSVIASRALPDVRDGLKPVQRRILFAMTELNNGPDKPHRKCARIVGDTMGKYHPHGDSSIYGALVNLAQDWSTRYPLIDGHGNFGSVDGDGAAAMRYTEARLSKVSVEMTADLNKDTVDFVPNFDETEKEPTVLPSRFPNLLVNGTSGIAVGMATNIPPHNLGESIDGVIKLIDDRVEQRETDIDDLLEIIKGPDFPTGAVILGRSGINSAYKTGRGKIKVRAVTEIQPLGTNRQQIIVTELPYMVNKARLVERIAELVRDKRIDGISDLRDESSREGMRVVIELKKDANANVVLNHLYKHTQLQDSFGVIMLALVNNVPKIMNLKEMLQYYLKHQEDVVTRRTKYELNKAEERAHILEGLLKALDFIDEVIAIIRGSENVAVAKARLMERFKLTDIQAQAIVDMRLRALTGLEREKLQAEYDELCERIKYLKSILGDEKILLGVIRDELTEIKEKYGDARRTQIGQDDEEILDEDLIKRENIVVTLSNLSYVKRMTTDNFHSQKRGGKGIKGASTIEDDFIRDIFMTGTHDTILFFTNQGRVYRLKGYEIPEASRIARGTPIINLIQLQPGERVTAGITIDDFNNDRYLLMATKRGIIKKTPLREYANIRRTGITGINLRDDDELIDVKYTDGEREVFLVTAGGKCIRFNEKAVRTTGRSSYGVKGMTLKSNDSVVGMQLDVQGSKILFVSEKGYGKRTDISGFKEQRRGGQGTICYKITEKTGRLIGTLSAEDDQEIMLITNNGTLIQMPVKGISVIGRNTSGVKLMNIKKDSDIKVTGISKVMEDDGEEEEKTE